MGQRCPHGRTYGHHCCKQQQGEHCKHMALWTSHAASRRVISSSSNTQIYTRCACNVAHTAQNGIVNILRYITPLFAVSYTHSIQQYTQVYNKTSATKFICCLNTLSSRSCCCRCAGHASPACCYINMTQRIIQSGFKAVRIFGQACAALQCWGLL